MNLYSFFKKKHSKPFLGAIFAVAFLSAFFAFKAPVQASLSDYENLFTTTNTPDRDPSLNPVSSIKIISLLKNYPGSTTNFYPDIKFQFIGSFPYKGKGVPHDKAWYWNHIRNFNESRNGNKNVFMLRICNTATTDENDCLFSVVPHLSEMKDDESLLCPNNVCTLPASNPENPTLATAKIYHYTAVLEERFGKKVLTHSNEQFSRFNVLFDVKELVKLKDGGLYTSVPLDNFKLGDPTIYKADIWYCAGDISGETLPSDEPTPNIRNFKNICGTGHPYFKIAESANFSLPKDATEAMNQINNPGQVDQVDASVVDSNTGSVLPVCHILNGAGPGEGSFMACIAQVGYYAIYMPSAWVAGILGRIMDFFLGYSISDESYRSTVIITGWKLVRDISNIFFIIILIWTGFSTVFDLGGLSMKKIVPTLIINALIINFSLFGTQVIIDISNVTARLFYNTMSVCKGPCEYRDTPTGREITNLSTDEISGYKTLSTKIVDSFDPQKIFSSTTLNPANSARDNDEDTKVDQASGGFNASGVSGNLEASKKLGIYDSDYASYFLIVSLLAAFIMLTMAKMFFSVMFMFVGRVVGLYMSMIFSPFAVLTKGNMPLVSNIKELSWSKWISDLTNYALLAPIFIFFLYIIYSFLNSDLMKILNLKPDAGFMNTVIAVCIPMIIIYMLVANGVTIAKKYAGAAGEMLQKYATQATGMVAGAAVGVASGSVALAGRNVIGRLGSRLASSEALQNTSARGGVSGAIADRILRTGGSLSRANYDVRNVNAVRTQLRDFGVNNVSSRIGGLLGTNQTQTTGGFQGAISRGVATETSRADRMLVTGQQAADVDARNRAWEQNYQTARTAAQNAANTQGTAFYENTFRQTYLNNQTAAGNARPQNSAEMNRARELQNNARLQRGSALARLSRVVTNRVTTPVGTTGAVASGAGALAASTAAVITGGAATVAAAVVGQGAIDNAVAQQVARQRENNARAPLSPTQIANLEARRDQLQQELTRRITLMNTIGATFNPPITFNNLTPANILDYQSDRQADITTRQTRIDAEQSFIDQHKNNPTMINQVNTARGVVRTLTNEQNNLRNDMRQAGNVLNEFNRIQTDIGGIRTQLGQ